MGKLLAAVVAATLAGVVLLGSLVAVLAAPGSPGGSSGPADAGGARAAVPPGWASLYQRAASGCPGLPWEVLAAIGTVESDNGRSSAPGVASGANPAGAEGPLQFEPATFAAYATTGPGGVRPPSPYDPVDAAYTAAAMLCADGGASASSLYSAVFAYNHSGTYVQGVLALALALGDRPGLSATVAAAVTFVGAQLGVPYRWGGSGPDGFDCSGLTRAAYGDAGVTLPRTAQEQFDAGPAIPAGAPVLPGDLVFFGSTPGGIGHVGLYVGAGEMIDAPHTGAPVRFDDAAWPDFVGATRPG